MSWICRWTGTHTSDLDNNANRWWGRWNFLVGQPVPIKKGKAAPCVDGGRKSPSLKNETDSNPVPSIILGQNVHFVRTGHILTPSGLREWCAREWVELKSDQSSYSIFTLFIAIQATGSELCMTVKIWSRLSNWIQFKSAELNWSKLNPSRKPVQTIHSLTIRWVLSPDSELDRVYQRFYPYKRICW